MENKIGEFNRIVKEDKENREFNKTLNPDPYGGVYRLYDHLNLKETYSFQLCSFTNYHQIQILGQRQNVLITLDEEDLEYFKKKYLPKLEDEMLQEIDKVIKKYKG